MPNNQHNPSIANMLDDLEQDIQRYNMNVECYCRGFAADQDVFWDNDSDPYLDGTFGQVNETILNEMEIV